MIDLVIFTLALAALAGILGACLWAAFAIIQQMLVWANEFIDIFKDDEDAV